MKKLLAILLTLSLLLCALPALAELGSADVVMEGETYRLTLESVDIVDGQLTVAISGFGNTLRWGADGPMVAGLPEARYGDEIVNVSTVNINVGAAFTFGFERAELPDEIWMNSYDEGVEPVLIWRAGDAETPGETAEAFIPAELVGEWRGVGTPKNGGTPIDLTIAVNADGSGEYTFDQGSYHENYPFTISNDDSTFSVDIPATSMLGSVGGTWALENGKLLLDITTTFANGGSYSYTAECEKVSADTSSGEPAEKASSMEIGEIVTFGHYEQDGDEANGPEPIEWIVLGAEADARLLIAKYGLYPLAYDNDDATATWETSGARAWLNSVFLNDAFNANEQALIIESSLENADNPEYGTDGGNDTIDRVFLLSIDELERYFPVQKDRVTTPTAYAKAQGAYTSNDNCWWQLRSPGQDQSYVCIVNASGFSGGVYPHVEVLYMGEDISVKEDCLRPAIWMFPPASDAPAGNPSSIETSDIVTFGHYEQDGDEANGPEPIEWIVLENDGETAKLISRYALDCKRYNDSYSSVTWETCTLREWLNTEFIDAAFSSAEQAKLMTTTVKAEKNPKYDTNPGNDTQDRVFLLSVNEAKKYFASDSARQAQPTTHAIYQGGYVKGGNCRWWLRSPGHNSKYAACVGPDGSFGGSNVNSGSYCVRPVVVLRLNGTEATPEPTEAPTPEPTEEPAPIDETPEEVSVEDVLNALNDDTYRATYEALLAGEVIQKGSKGDAAKGVQQTLVAFGQDIAVDGSVGPKTIAALNAVQAAFGLEQTAALDAAGYAELLPRLLMVVNPDEADALLAGQMDGGEYDYMRACALAAQGKFYSAKQLFTRSGFGDWEARVDGCVQPWPKNGVLYKNPNVKGSNTELTVKFNTDPDTAMLVKVYTTDDVLARTMFIGGTGRATCSLPAGTYVIKDGVGKNWYGEEEAFGKEGYYEIMTFGDDEQEVLLKGGYSSTITVNVQEGDSTGEGVGSDWESWDDF